MIALLGADHFRLIALKPGVFSPVQPLLASGNRETSLDPGRVALDGLASQVLAPASLRGYNRPMASIGSLNSFVFLPDFPAIGGLGALVPRILGFFHPGIIGGITLPFSPLPAMSASIILGGGDANLE